MKKIFIAILLCCTLFLSAGCGSFLVALLEGSGALPVLDDLVDQMEDLAPLVPQIPSPNPPEQEVPPVLVPVEPEPAAPITPSPAPPAPVEPPAPTPDPGISVNMDLLRMIGRTYADLRAVNNGNGDCFAYDGRAYAGYVGEPVSFPVGFFLDVEFDAFYRLVTGDNPIIVWPDDSIVSGVLVWYYIIRHVFHSDGKITLDALSEFMTMPAGLWYVPEEEQEMEAFGHDVWYGTLYFDRYQMYATFYMEGGDLVLIEAHIE